MPPIKRSPAHPTSTLAQAIDRARRLYAAVHDHWVPIDAVAATWGSSPKSSGFLQSIATQKQFGLLEEKGSNESREFKLTDTALDILTYDEGDLHWLRAVQVAALSPAIHDELWTRFDKHLPPEDAMIRVYLVRQRENGTFHPEQVDGFIRQLRDTLEFAGLTGSGTNAILSAMDATIPKVDPDEPEVRDTLEVGNHVQWTSGGKDMFAEPKKILQMSEDGDWAFLEGSPTGVPMSELTLAKTPLKKSEAKALGTPPQNPLFREVASIGPRIEFPLPDDNSIQIQLRKPVSKKTFERIKQLIALSEDSLVDESDG